mgnify:CR=1 FL=1
MENMLLLCKDLYLLYFNSYKIKEAKYEKQRFSDSKATETIRKI